MQRNVTARCAVHADRFSCPDSLISYNPVFDEYGIIIHDGGKSSITVNYCPWCGEKLLESKRNRWLEELEQLGFDSTFDQDIPNK